MENMPKIFRIDITVKRSTKPRWLAAAEASHTQEPHGMQPLNQTIEFIRNDERAHFFLRDSIAIS